MLAVDFLSGELHRFVPEDRLKSPEHIAPVWYFSPFYSILRTSNFINFGVTIVLAALLDLYVLLITLVLFVDRQILSKNKNFYFKHKWRLALALTILLASNISLGFIAYIPFEASPKVLTQVLMSLHFLVILLFPYYVKASVSRESLITGDIEVQKYQGQGERRC